MGKKVSELTALPVGDVVEADDLLAVFDTGANKLKKISVEDFLTLAPGLDINGLSAISFADIGASDTIPIYDIAAGANKKVTVQFLFDYVTKNLDDVSTIASGDIVQANDFVFVYDATLGNVVKLSVSDFLSLAGGGGGLTNFTESTGTNGFGADTYNALTASGGGTNIDAAFSPKGNGALVAKVGSTNDRGVYAVDFQMNLATGSDAVAQGPYSCITHGLGNKVDTTGSYARAGGRYAMAKRFGEDAWAGASSFNTSGGADQMSKMVLFESTTGDGTADMELSADSSTMKRVTIDDDSLLRVVVDSIAVCTAQGNGTVVVDEIHSGTFFAVVKNLAGTSVVVGSGSIGTAIEGVSMAGANIGFDIDAVTQDLKILFSPPTLAGTTSTFRVVASVHITEMRSV